jgi:hypothetical protein
VIENEIRANCVMKGILAENGTKNGEDPSYGRTGLKRGKPNRNPVFGDIAKTSTADSAWLGEI